MQVWVDVTPVVQWCLPWMLLWEGTAQEHQAAVNATEGLVTAHLSDLQPSVMGLQPLVVAWGQGYNLVRGATGGAHSQPVTEENFGLV